MDNRNIIVLDFETSSANPSTTQILQIGAVAVNQANLTIVDSFESLVKPDDWSTVEEGALAVNKLKREELEEAPAAKVIFPIFAKWIQKYNTRKDKGTFGAPIPAGWGIANFDMPIFTRYAHDYGYWDTKWNNQTLLNPIFMFDAMQHMWAWLRRLSEPANVKLSTVLSYMGLSEAEIQGAHSAAWDSKWTAEVIIRLLRMMEWFTTDIKEKGSHPRLVFANTLTTRS